MKNFKYGSGMFIFFGVSKKRVWKCIGVEVRILIGDFGFLIVYFGMFILFYFDLYLISFNICVFGLFL